MLCPQGPRSLGRDLKLSDRRMTFGDPRAFYSSLTLSMLLSVLSSAVGSGQTNEGPFSEKAGSYEATELRLGPSGESTDRLKVS
jgi:hypothetical protein